MGVAKKLAADLVEHVEKRVVDLSDQDYLDCLEEVVDTLKMSIEAKGEEIENEGD